MRRARIVAAASIWACAGAALGQGPESERGGPAVSPLRAALDAAWTRSAVQRQALARQHLARAEKARAESPWSSQPALEWSQREEHSSNGPSPRELGASVAMPLWWPGQRSAAQQTAQSSLNLAQASERVLRLELADTLRLLVWDWAQAQAEAELAHEQAMGLQRLTEDVERRVAAGDLALTDALAARSEERAAQVEHRQRLTQVQALRSRWTNLTGLADAPPSLPEPTSRAGWLEREVHPQFAEAEQAAQTARYRLDLTKRSAREPAQISLGVRRDTAALNGLQSQSLLVGLRVPLGAPARQRWLEAAVQSELDAALIEQERLRERLLREREDARAALESAALQYRLQHERARLLQDRAQLIEKAFRLGENSLPETLRARAAAAVAQAETARQYAAWGRAQARLETLLGLLP